MSKDCSCPSELILDEAIAHALEKVKELKSNGCKACAENHLQLAKWLQELKDYRKKEGR